MVETKKTFCRFCHVFCGMEVDVEGGRVIAVRGDRDNEVTRGYSCQKGRAEIERIYHPDRLLSAQKRDGNRWSSVARPQALDKVATRLRDIVAEHGPDSVAVYTGCGGHRTSAGGPWFVRRWLDALGSQPSVIVGWFNWVRSSLATRIAPRSLVAQLGRDYMKAHTPAEMQ